MQLFDATTWLQKYPHLVIAYSGGRDSAALLHAFCVAAQHVPGAKIEVAHIHHGLQAVADSWIEHATAIVHSYKAEGIPIDLHIYKVQVNTGPQVSIEEQARKERYKALYTCVKHTQASAIALGHHLNDQAETFLLQAARGVGVAGMSAMAEEMQRNNIWRIRPMLSIDRREIDRYVQHHQIPYIDDPSNNDNIYRRNLLRNEILPALREEIPGVDKAFAKAAQHCAEAQEALQWMGKEDLRHATERNIFLPLKAKEWPTWRQKNVLRYWYSEQFGHPMPTSVLDRIMTLWKSGGNGRVPCPQNRTLLWSPRRLHIEDNGKNKDQSAIQKIEVRTPVFTHEGREWHWRGPLPTILEYGPRRPGSTLSLGTNRPPRPLKKQYQALQLAQEQHGFWYDSTGNLLFAPGIGINYQYPVLSDTPFVQENHSNPSPLVEL